MNPRISLAFVALAALALVGCSGSPAPTAASSSAPASPAASPSASETASPTPTVAAASTANADDYLLNGAIGADGDTWGANFGFFTDSSKAVRCDIAVSSEAAGRLTCQVMVGQESAVMYAVPSPVTDQCNPSSSTYRDGYEVGLGLFQSIGTDSGFYACRELQAKHPDWVAATKVIPDNATITVKEFSCTVLSGIATCGRPGKSGGFVFGLPTATFLN